jgi:hypothetical protein
VSGIDGASWNNKRLHGVAFTFQVRNSVVELHRDESSNVLTNDPSGPDFAYNPEHFRPERTVIRRASSLPGLGKWLAREPPGKQGCAPVSGSVKGSDISVDSRTASLIVNVRYGLILFGFCPCRSPALASGVGHSPEVLLDDLLRIRFNLHERDGLESRPLCGNSKAADARKQINVSQIPTNSTRNP